MNANRQTIAKSFPSKPVRKFGLMRPLAALLVLSMAGSVYASDVDSDIACVSEESRRASNAQPMPACEAVSPERPATEQQLSGRDASLPSSDGRAAVNDLNDHLSFGGAPSGMAQANSDYDIAIGSGATADGEWTGHAIALGVDAKATAWNSMAIGGQSEVTMIGGIAIGIGAKVHNDGNTGLADSIAIGYEAFVGPDPNGWADATDGHRAVAIGAQTWASGEGSVALGAGSKAEDAFTVSVGNDTLQRRIVNVGAGTDIYDAVNVMQLRGAATALGGGADIDANGNFVAPTYTIQGTDHRTVEGALAALDTDMTDVKEQLQDLGDGGGDNGLISQDADGKLSVGGNTDGTTVDFAGTAGARVLTGVADGRIALGSQDAINGGQLAAMQDELDGKLEALDDRVDELEQNPGNGGGEGPGNGGGTPPGNDAGGRPIENVGDGIADSDAATVGQMNQQVQQAIDTAKSYTDQRVDALSQELDSFKGEVSDRFDRQDARISRVGAMSAAMSQMAFSTQGINTPNRVGVGVGMQGGKSAIAVGYSRSIAPNVNLSFSGSASGSEMSTGVGLGIGW